MTLARTVAGKTSRLRWIVLGVVVGLCAGGLGKAPAGTAIPAVFKVGAAKVSIAPDETKWQKTGCFEIDSANPNLEHVLPKRGHGWPLATPDCVYLGGFDIGPVRAATGVDDGGVYVRALAVSNDQTTFAFGIIDAVGYFARYQDALVAGVMNGVCSDCGLLDIRQKISTDKNIPADNIVLASTHTHSGPDGYGGWGGLPDWYWLQLRDAYVSAVESAIDNLEPATLTAGSVVLRNRNNERRDTYYSTPDYQAVYLQAKSIDGSHTIATLANYAGHPTILGSSNRILHADWPGATSRRFEALYGGVGLLFEGGLGNVSINSVGGPTADQNAENTGVAIADVISNDLGKNGTTLTTNTMAAHVDHINHPVMTNQGLAVLGSLGLFSREFTPGTPGAGGPGAYKWSKSSLWLPAPEQPDLGYMRGCASASALSINTFAGAFKIGEFGIVYGPGELFSNMTEVAKSKLNNNVALATFAQSNDALGYIMQSFEYDYLGGGAVGEYGTQHGEYEEVFAIDHCFGDHVLQSMLDAGRAVGL